MKVNEDKPENNKKKDEQVANSTTPEDVMKSLTPEQQKNIQIFSQIFAKGMEPYAQIIAAQGKKLSELEGVIQEIAPVFAQLKPLLAQGGGQQPGPPTVQGQNGNQPADPSAINGLLNFLGTLVGGNKGGDQALGGFFANMGMKYFEAMANQFQLINTVLIKRAFGDAGSDILGTQEMK